MTLLKKPPLIGVYLEGNQLLLNWYRSIKQKRILKKQLLQLGPLLAQRYSRSQFYTFAQVEATLKILDVQPDSHIKGYAMFLDEASYEQNVSSPHGARAYHQMRESISTRFFEGSMKFDTPTSVKFKSLNSNFTSVNGQQDQHFSGYGSPDGGSD